MGKGIDKGSGVDEEGVLVALHAETEDLSGAPSECVDGMERPRGESTRGLKSGVEVSVFGWQTCRALYADTMERVVEESVFLP